MFGIQHTIEPNLGYAPEETKPTPVATKVDPPAPEKTKEEPAAEPAKEVAPPVGEPDVVIDLGDDAPQEGETVLGEEEEVETDELPADEEGA